MAERIYNSVPLNAPIEFVDAEPMKQNPMISKVKVKIAYSEMNRNGSIIPKKTMTDMAKRSLRGTPIVGYYLKQKNDFSDHEVRLMMDETGDIEEVRMTQAYGYVPENAEVYWEKYKDHDDVAREYLVTDGYLWTKRHPETERIFSEGNNNQSMELDPETVKGQWAKVPNQEGEFFVIEEANFTALCILGADVEPAFEGASIVGADFKLSKLAKREYEEEMDEFKQKLAFALKHEFNDDSLKVAKVDTEEEEEGIKHAIEELDEAAETEPSEEGQKAIDSAIDTLLDVEQTLQTEDELIPQNEEDKETIEGMGGSQSDIISNPEYGKATPITTPFIEEEEEMTEEEKEALRLEEEAKLEEEKKQEEGKPFVEDEEEEVIVTIDEDPEAEIEPILEVEEVAEEEEGRQSADDKRQERQIEGLDDTELLEILIDRMEQADDMKARIEALVADQSEAEEEKEEDFAEDEDKEKKDEPKDEEAVEEDIEEAKDEDKDKFELEISDLSKKLFASDSKVKALEKELESLRNFQLRVKREEKETMLNKFSLLEDEDKNAIRLDFDNLTVEDVESKCAVQYYRKGLIGTSGQNSTEKEDVVSYNLEQENTVPGWIQALRKQ